MSDQIPLTFELLGQIMGIVTPLIGVWWWLSRQISAVRNALAAYQLEAAEKYTRAEHLRQFEERLIATETRTLEAINQLTGRIDNLIQSNKKD